MSIVDAPTRVTASPANDLLLALESIGLHAARHFDGSMTAAATERDEWGNQDALCAYRITPAPVTALAGQVDGISTAESAFLADTLEGAGFQVAVDEEGVLVAGDAVAGEAFYLEQVA